MPANPGVYNGGAPIRGLVSLPAPATTEMLTVDAAGNMSRQAIPIASFGALTGSPSDNAALSSALAAKVNLAGDTMTGKLRVPAGDYFNAGLEVGSLVGMYDSSGLVVRYNGQECLQLNQSELSLRSSQEIGWTGTTSATGTVDSKFVRNGVGQADFRGDSGFRTRNLANSGWSALQTGAINSYGTLTHQPASGGNTFVWDNNGIAMANGRINGLSWLQTQTGYVTSGLVFNGIGSDASTSGGITPVSGALRLIPPDSGTLKSVYNSGTDAPFTAAAITASGTVTGTQAITSATYVYGQPQFRNSNYGTGSGFQIVTAATTAIYGNSNAVISFNDTINGILIDGSRPLGWVNGHALANVADVTVRRNATGPALETRSAGGLRVRNADGSAAGALDCGAITASGQQTISRSSFSSYAPYLVCRNESGYSEAELQQGLSSGYGGTLTLRAGDVGNTGFLRLRYDAGYPKIETNNSSLTLTAGTAMMRLTGAYHDFHGNGGHWLTMDSQNFDKYNGTNPQTLRVFNTRTSATNFETLQTQWTSNEARIGTAVGSAGGTQRNLVLGSWNAAGTWVPAMSVRPTDSAYPVKFHGSSGIWVGDQTTYEGGRIWSSANAWGIANASSSYGTGAMNLTGWNGNTLQLQGGMENTTNLAFAIDTDNNDPTSAFYFMAGSNNTGNPATNGLVKFEKGGNVGIGTMSPAARLHVNGTIMGSTKLLFSGTTSSDYGFINATSTRLILGRNSTSDSIITIGLNPTAGQAGITMRRGEGILWSGSTSSSEGGGVTAGVLSPSADLVEINNGTAGQTRDLSCRAITASGVVQVPIGSAAAPTYTFTGDTDTGIYSSQANTMDMAFGGVARHQFQSDGSILLGGTDPWIYHNNFTIRSPSVGTINLRGGVNASDATVNLGTLNATGQITIGAADLILLRDAANTLAQRNGTAAQSNRIYRTYTSGAVNHYYAIVTNNGSNGYDIGTVNNGVTNYATRLVNNGTTMIEFAADNTNIILRQRSLNFGSVNGGEVVLRQITPFSGVLNVIDAASASTYNDIALRQLIIGGASSATTSRIKNTSGTMNFRLGDDSADADVTTKAITASGDIIHRTATNNLVRLTNAGGEGVLVFGNNTNATTANISTTSASANIRFSVGGNNRLDVSGTTVSVNNANLYVGGSVTLAEASNLILGTTTGTRIGTATTQRIGFFNATPVVQPAAVADATDAASVITQLNALLSRMRDLGLIAV